MAELVSYLSIVPHMRASDVPPTPQPRSSGAVFSPLDFLGRDQASLFAPSEPRQSADEQARNHNHHSGDEYGQAGKQQEVAQEIEHIAQQQLNTIPLR
jgi:hypothetical protein